jgi:phosphorylcholine metabolism protein LicD
VKGIFPDWSPVPRTQENKQQKAKFNKSERNLSWLEFCPQNSENKEQKAKFNKSERNLSWLESSHQNSENKQENAKNSIQVKVIFPGWSPVPRTQKIYSRMFIIE